MVCTDVEIGQRLDGLREGGVGGLVGDHDDARAARLPTLDRPCLSCRTSAMLTSCLAEFRCHGGQYAGPVRDVHVDVVAGGG